MGNGEEKIIGKIVLEGTLKLCSPMLIGDGMGDKNHDNDKDIHVLKNQDGYPFIPGTSLAGAGCSMTALAKPGRRPHRPGHRNGRQHGEIRL